jgi:hypothetical protein
MRFLPSQAVARKVHTFLSLFFTPLLVLFVATGFWQMLIPEETREQPGRMREWLEKLSTVHTEGYWPKAGTADPSVFLFKLLAGALCAALLLSILLGLFLAWKSARRKRWVVLALGLGVAVPALVLWLA